MQKVKCASNICSCQKYGIIGEESFKKQLFSTLEPLPPTHTHTHTHKHTHTRLHTHTHTHTITHTHTNPRFGTLAQEQVLQTGKQVLRLLCCKQSKYLILYFFLLHISIKYIRNSELIFSTFIYRAVCWRFLFQSSEQIQICSDDWREISKKQFVNKCRKVNF